MTLQPLAKTEQQQGLHFLPQLSRPAGALVAVNGGFSTGSINSLGALRRWGVWLSGPILNRGRLGGSGDRQRPAPANQSLQVNNGRRWGVKDQQRLCPGAEPLHTRVGPRYRVLSGEEEALDS